MWQLWVGSICCVEGTSDLGQCVTEHSTLNSVKVYGLLQFTQIIWKKYGRYYGRWKDGGAIWLLQVKNTANKVIS